MVKIQCPTGSKWLFARFPESDAETRELATMVSLYRAIERSGVKTGLYIVAEVPFHERTLVVSSLERKETMTLQQLADIQNAVLGQLTIFRST